MAFSWPVVGPTGTGPVETCLRPQSISPTGAQFDSPGVPALGNLARPSAGTTGNGTSPRPRSPSRDKRGPSGNGGPPQQVRRLEPTPLLPPVLTGGQPATQK